MLQEGDRNKYFNWKKNAFGNVAETSTVTGPLSEVISSFCMDAERLADLGLPLYSM